MYMYFACSFYMEGIYIEVLLKLITEKEKDSDLLQKDRNQNKLWKFLKFLTYV